MPTVFTKALNFEALQSWVRNQTNCKLPVAAVSKWSNYKTGGISQIFIAIFQAGGDHAQHHFVILPEVTQLRNPRKVI